MHQNSPAELAQKVKKTIEIELTFIQKLAKSDEEKEIMHYSFKKR